MSDWTTAQMVKLRAMRDDGATIAQIADELGKTARDIADVCSAFNIPSRVAPGTGSRGRYVMNDSNFERMAVEGSRKLRDAILSMLARRAKGMAR